MVACAVHLRLFEVRQGVFCCRLARSHPGVKSASNRRHIQVAHGMQLDGSHGSTAAGFAVHHDVDVACGQFRASTDLEFEQAAAARDALRSLKDKVLLFGA